MAATAQLLTQLAQDLASNNCEVTAFAGRGSYAPEHSRPLDRKENWGNIIIRRVWCTNFGRRNNIGRMADYLTFLWSAALAVLFSPRQDVLVCLSTPPFVALLGVLGTFRGSKFVYKVEDLYPDIAIALGTLRRNRLTRILEFLSNLIISKADAVVALDQNMAAQIDNRGAKAIHVIPNWADGKQLNENRTAYRKVADALTVLYSGNLGFAHRFDAVISAAQILAEINPGIRFRFVGGGSRLQEVKRAAAMLSNVEFMDYQPREKLNELYGDADIHLVTLRDETAGMQVPSKYSAALASGRPVLLVGGKDSSLGDEIQLERVGWICNHDPEQVAATLIEAMAHPDHMQAMGQAGRRLFEKKYDRSICTAKWINLLNEVGMKHGPHTKAIISCNERPHSDALRTTND